MRKRVFATATAILLSVLLSPNTSLQLRANSTPCGTDPSGAYTNLLCPNEHIYASAYLVDANNRYRFYYESGGYAVIYDQSTNPPTPNVIHPLPTSDTPWIMVFVTNASVTRLEAYNNDEELEYVISANSGSGDHFARLDTDGCLRFYSEGGSNVIATFGGCS